MGAIARQGSTTLGVTSPPTDAALVTPNDSTDLTTSSRAISFVTAGDLKVTTLAGTTLVIPSGALAAGILHPLQLARIWSTGTTAAGIVAYF